jgi:Sec-independent protein secretion pathway component TatC
MVSIAVPAALLRTLDPLTLILEMIPLIALYELSILLAAALVRPGPEAAAPAPFGGELRSGPIRSAAARRTAGL